MNKIAQSMKQFLNEEEGVTAIEYALIAFLIAVFIIGSVTAVGGAVDGVFNQVAAALTAQ
jgi:pilus assembly protein Flp/PilA